MKVSVTEYLRIDLDTEQWECRRCGHVHGSARENYKKFMLIHDRDPREIHRPILDPERYAFNFSPDPKVCAIYEFYCPCCGTMIEAEYTVPGHEPLHDMELDIDALKKQWESRGEAAESAAMPEISRKAPGCAHRH
jgi:acetone carboxylase gamma subunit